MQLPDTVVKPPRKRAEAKDSRERSRQSRRLVALIVDNILCFPLLFPSIWLMEAIGGTRIGAGFVWLAACLLYFFLLELHTGQTIGKRLTGLRVVRVDGKPVDVMGIGARNCLRPIDSIPGIPLVGALSMALTGERSWFRLVDDDDGGGAELRADVVLVGPASVVRHGLAAEHGWVEL